MSQVAYRDEVQLCLAKQLEFLQDFQVRWPQKSLKSLAFMQMGIDSCSLFEEEEDIGWLHDKVFVDKDGIGAKHVFIQVSSTAKNLLDSEAGARANCFETFKNDSFW